MQIGRFLMSSALDRFERMRNFSLNNRALKTIRISVDKNSRSVRDEGHINTGTSFTMTARFIAPRNPRLSPISLSFFSFTIINRHATNTKLLIIRARRTAEPYDGATIKRYVADM